MFKSAFHFRALSFALVALTTADAWAAPALISRLPGPGIFALVAAAVAGAVAVARSRK